jgi:hypothetical protein
LQTFVYQIAVKIVQSINRQFAIFDAEKIGIMQPDSGKCHVPLYLVTRSFFSLHPINEKLDGTFSRTLAIIK